MTLSAEEQLGAIINVNQTYLWTEMVDFNFNWGGDPAESAAGSFKSVPPTHALGGSYTHTHAVLEPW